MQAAGCRVQGLFVLSLLTLTQQSWKFLDAPLGSTVAFTAFSFFFF